MKERWRQLTGYCDGCNKEMRPVREAKCAGRMFDSNITEGAVVECRCGKKEFVWDIIA